MVSETNANGRLGAWICLLGLVVCLMGCQPQTYKTPSLSPPPAAKAPRLQVRPTFYVAVNQLNLLDCPGKDCRKIAILELNTEVEKMGEVENWTQVKVKKGNIIGYVSSRYLSPQPVQVARTTKKRPKKAKPRKATQPAEVAGTEREAEPKEQEPAATPLPRVM